MNASPRSCAHCGAATPDDATTCLVCGQPRSETERLAPDLLATPPLQGRYHLLTQLGVGGFGAVYRAEDAGLGHRIVAVKEMAQGGLKPAELADATEAFQREAYLLAGLKHPNLPHIYDHFSEAGRWYLVLDFIEGQTLETILARALDKRLPVNDVLKIGLQLANVLHYLHTNQPPIIFRDLKPANVMLTANDHAYLIDFGIARLFKPGQAKDTLIIGTPGYLAPEGYGKAQTTPRSDIYSLGATLHQLLSGSDPGERPFFFVPLQSPVPAPLHALVAQMVQMDERDRPASMAEVTARLHQIAESSALASSTAALTSSSPAEYGPASPQTDKAPAQQPRIVPAAGKLYLPTLPPIQHKAAVTRRTVAIGLGAVLAGGAIWALAHTVTPTPRVSEAPIGTATPTTTNPLPSTPTPPATPTPPSNSLGTTVYQIFRGHSQPVMAVAWSPLDGAAIASASLDTTTQIWDTSLQLVIVTHEGLATRMIWSPDGQYIATSGGTDYKIHVWRASSGEDLHSYPIQAEGDLPALAWSPNIDLLASSDDSGKIQIWVPDNGGNDQVNVFGGTIGGTLALAWLPDDQRILSGSGAPDNKVYLWNAQTGAILATYEGHKDSVTVLAVSPDGQYFASASLDNTVCVWKINSNISPIVFYKGHTSLIQSVAWSPDSKRIASGGSDNTVQVWDAATGGNVFIYRGHTAPVTSIDWSTKNNRIASGSFDTTVQIWQPQ